MRVGGDGLGGKCPRCGWDHAGERTKKSQKFYHAVLSTCFENWPSAHVFQPNDVRHLRAWIMCHPDVAHCDCLDADPGDVTAVAALLAAHKAAGGFGFVAIESGVIRLKLPRTSALAANGGLTRGPFYSLVSRVLAVIEEETGIPRDDLRREGLAAVAPGPRLGKRKAA